MQNVNSYKSRITVWCVLTEESDVRQTSILPNTFCVIGGLSGKLQHVCALT